LPQYLTLYRF